MEHTNCFDIKEGEKLYLDGIELKRVLSYNVQHSAGEPAELTITLEVRITSNGR